MDDQDKLPAGDVVMIAGGDVTTLSVSEDGSVEMERQRWRDFWPNGSVFLTEDREVVGMKLNDLWVDGTGDLLKSLEGPMDAPIITQLSEDAYHRVWNGLVAVLRARTQFNHFVVEATDARVSGL